MRPQTRNILPARIYRMDGIGDTITIIPLNPYTMRPFDSSPCGDVQCISASPHQSSVHGIYQHGGAVEGDHLGERISYSELPEALRRKVTSELRELRREIDQTANPSEVRR